MIYVRNKVDIKFKTKKEPFIECGLGASFYVLMYSEHTCIQKGFSSSVCFPVPTHYPSFILSFTGYLEKNVEKIFSFEHESDIKIVQDFVDRVSFNDAALIKEFTIYKRKNVK